MIKRLLAILLVLVFSLTATLAIAADSSVVIKDKHGVCKVIKSDHKTPKTIAGPFASKDEAKKVKDKECPKENKPAKSGKLTPK